MTSETLNAVHRTWVQFMIEANFRELAALSIDGEITRFMHDDDYDNTLGFYIDLPPSAYNFILQSESLGQTMEQFLRQVLHGREKDDVEIKIRLKLLDVEDNWKEVTRSSLINTP